MKKWFTAMLCLLMISAAALCAAEYKGTVLPLLSQLVDASMTDGFSSEDGSRSVAVYTPATEDDVDEFLALAAACGVFPIDMQLDEGAAIEGYYLVEPGTPFEAMVIYEAGAKELSIEFPTEITYIMGEETAAGIRMFYDYDVRLPSGSGGNTAPQFYAVINRQPFYQGTVGEASFAFDGATCWTEWYDEVEMDKIREYTIIMGMFGFYPEVDAYDFEEDGTLGTTLLCYSNGDAEILLLYSAAEKTATVYYEPGVTYNLLSGSDLNDILPQ